MAAPDAAVLGFGGYDGRPNPVQWVKSFRCKTHLEGASEGLITQNLSVVISSIEASEI